MVANHGYSIMDHYITYYLAFLHDLYSSGLPKHSTCRMLVLRRLTRACCSGGFRAAKLVAPKVSLHVVQGIE